MYLRLQICAAAGALAWTAAPYYLVEEIDWPSLSLKLHQVIVTV